MTTAPAPAAAITISGLRKSFGEVEVLTGVDLTVATGSITALLGSNGAGKTTLVRILATLTHADSGVALVDGVDVAKAPELVRQRVSLTGQDAAVDEILSGRENLVLVGRLRHVADPGATADHLLARVGLGEAGRRRAGTYSGGMRRRLDIAMSLVGPPAVLFLDEPTTGLDPQGRLEVWDLVRELADSGTTVLLTTQYLDEAEHLADRIAILHEGRILTSGSLAELQALLPLPEAEQVVRQPSLESVFLALTSHAAAGSIPAKTTQTNPSQTSREGALR